MNISNTGLNFIKKWEGGPWLTAKRFGSEQYLSIGYGHYGPDVLPGQKITKEEAEQLLIRDVKKHVDHVNLVNNIYHYDLNQNQFDALVSFSYNIGSIYQLTARGTRSKAVIGDKMLLYVKSGGKTVQGLVNRRKAEHDMYISAPVSEPINPPKKKTNSQLAKEVIKGLWGNGEIRKKRLTEAGYSYTAVQKLVNKYLKEGKF